ncbi:MAG: 4Fe-4S dicluster domain-containing protein [Myxococcota bacterium]
MAWVITRLCRDCIDQSCVDVCPVECIYEYTGSDKESWPNQLYIHPDECIDCGACEPECPWEAIYEDVSVPEVLKDDVELNHKMMDHKDEFRVPEHVDKPQPTPDQVVENKKKWGLEG